jgi:hypothetical protein
MFRYSGSTICLALMACLTCSCDTHAAESPTTRPAVVVELFTSEGCSSCPPADVVLANLAKPGAVVGVEIIALELHVDYWNGLGWADPFSSPDLSRRQENYAKVLQHDQIYTPQMIVDGSEEFVGSDRGKARDAIGRAAGQPKGTISLDLAPFSKDTRKFDCQISVAGISPKATGQVLLALTEDGLSTDVRRGENAGEKLHHSAVVRSLREVATIMPGDASPFNVKATVEVKPTWQLDHLKVVVFAQDAKSGKVLAATQKPVEEIPQK